MSKAVSPSCDKPYGLARVCRVWAVGLAVDGEKVGARWLGGRAGWQVGRGITLRDGLTKPAFTRVQPRRKDRLREIVERAARGQGVALPHACEHGVDLLANEDRVDRRQDERGILRVWVLRVNRVVRALDDERAIHSGLHVHTGAEVAVIKVSAVGLGTENV